MPHPNHVISSLFEVAMYMNLSHSHILAAAAAASASFAAACEDAVAAAASSQQDQAALLQPARHRTALELQPK